MKKITPPMIEVGGDEEDEWGEDVECSPEDYTDFCCPFCGGREYQSVGSHNGIYGPGGGETIIGYECCECTIRFGDPRCFTEAGQKRKNWPDLGPAGGLMG